MTNENKPGYKKTKLGWIPEEWEVVRFETIANFFSGGTPTSTETSNYGGDIPFIRSGEIYSTKTEQFLSEKGFENSSAKLVERGDILYALYGANSGETSISQINGAINQAILCIKTEQESMFILNFLQKSKNSIISKFLQGGQGNLSGKIIKNLKIPLPPFAEQKKIAQILSTWDKAIEQTQALLTQLQLRKKGLMQQLLTGKTRLKGFEGEWEEKRIDHFITFTPRPIAKPSTNYLALGLRSHGKGIFHKKDFDPNKIAMDVLYEVKENDLVVNITFAWEHAIAIADKKDEGGLVSHRFPTFVFIEGIADPMFFRYFILQKKFKYLLDLISPGGAGRNRVMSKKDFPKLQVKIPPFAEQNAIANILTTVDAEILQAEKYLTSLQTQKKGLMQQLLTGQKRVELN